MTRIASHLRMTFRGWFRRDNVPQVGRRGSYLEAHPGAWADATMVHSDGRGHRSKTLNCHAAVVKS